jgi:hypothetical protein
MNFACTSRCKVILMLTALIIVCVGGGGLIGFVLGRKHERNRNQAAAWNQEVMSALHRKLKPDAEQEQRFQAAVDAAVSAMQIERNNAIQNTDVIVQKLITDIRNELRDEQRAEFDKLAKNRGKATLDLLKVEKRAEKK